MSCTAGSPGQSRSKKHVKTKTSSTLASSSVEIVSKSSWLEQRVQTKCQSESVTLVSKRCKLPTQTIPTLFIHIHTTCWLQCFRPQGINISIASMHVQQEWCWYVCITYRAASNTSCTVSLRCEAALACRPHFRLRNNNIGTRIFYASC